MATDKLLVPNIDNSDSTNFPNGRIKDNTGIGNGTPVNRLLYGDLHEFFAKLMRMAKITYNGLPDSEGNGYQLVQALQAIANKNDLLVALNSVGGKLQITSVKLSTLILNEMLICKAAADYANETELDDSEVGVSFTVTISNASKYKANDYLMLVKTSTGITIIRMANAENIDVLVGALSYLKAASSAEAITGVITTKAVTPGALLAAFTDWVNGTDSASFLATHTVNGLMSKTDKILLDSLNNPVKNVGWISGVDCGGMTVGSAVPRSGNISSAVVTSVAPNETFIQIGLQNAMANINYFVRLHLESQGSIAFDNDVLTPVFKIIDASTFSIGLQEFNAIGHTVTQNLKIHIEVVQIS